MSDSLKFYLIIMIIFAGLGIGSQVAKTIEGFLTKRKMEANLVNSLGFFLNAKTQEVTNEVDDATKRIENTNQLLSLIQDMVELEVHFIFQKLLSLHSKYEYANLDKDIQRISTKVKDAISNTYLEKNGTILENDYIFKYIITQTTSILMTSGLEYNQALLKNEGNLNRDTTA